MMSSSSSNGAGTAAAAGGIATVAQRIRDRALQLEATRLELSQLQTTVQTARDTLATERRANAAVRTDLLTALQSRHGVELELLSVQDRTVGVEEEIAQLHVETEQIRQATAARRTKWSSVEAAVCVPHEVEAGTYQLAARDVVRRLDEQRERRTRRLTQLTDRTHLALEDCADMQREMDRLREEMAEMESREEAEDEEVAALAMQIRATIRKKASLRGAVEEARHRHGEANERMLRMEREVTKYSASSSAASAYGCG